jgi:hypothetical protein
MNLLDFNLRAEIAVFVHAHFCVEAIPNVAPPHARTCFERTCRFARFLAAKAVFGLRFVVRFRPASRLITACFPPGPDGLYAALNAGRRFSANKSKTGD